MVVTHKLTNKKDPRNILHGAIEHGSYNPKWDTFDFSIEGTVGSNGFWTQDWDVEEVVPPVELPAKPYAVISFYDEEYAADRVFWRAYVGSQDTTYWIEDDSDEYNGARLKLRIEEYGGGKFTVLFAGAEPEQVETAGF
jgi:hypothetical protein